LAIENHGGTSATGAGLKRLFDRVPFPSVGVTCDPANYAYGGELETLMDGTKRSIANLMAAIVQARRQK